MTDYSVQARALFQQLDGGKLKDSNETIGTRNGKLEQIEYETANLPFVLTGEINEEQFVAKYNEAMQKAEQEQTLQQFEAQIADIKTRYEEIKDNKKTFGVEKTYSEMTTDELHSKFKDIGSELDAIEQQIEVLTQNGTSSKNYEKLLELFQKQSNKIKELEEIHQLLEKRQKEEESALVRDYITTADIVASSLDSNLIQKSMDDIEYLLQKMPEEYKEELEACKSRLSNAMSISTTHTQE